MPNQIADECLRLETIEGLHNLYRDIINDNINTGGSLESSGFSSLFTSNLRRHSSNELINIPKEDLQNIYYNFCKSLFIIGIPKENISHLLEELFRIESYNLMTYNISKNKMKNILLTGGF